MLRVVTQLARNKLPPSFFRGSAARRAWISTFLLSHPNDFLRDHHYLDFLSSVAADPWPRATLALAPAAAAFYETFYETFVDAIIANEYYSSHCCS
jgi:hypothetical protein